MMMPTEQSEMVYNATERLAMHKAVKQFRKGKPEKASKILAPLGMTEQDVYWYLHNEIPSFTQAQLAVLDEANRLLDADGMADVHDLLAEAGLTLDDTLLRFRMRTVGVEPIVVEPVREAGPAVGGASTSSAPESTGRSVTLPDGTDTTDPHLRARVEARIRDAYGSTWIPLWPLLPDELDGIAPVIPLIDSRPGAVTISLSADAKPTDGHRVAEAGARQGYGDLVHYNPYMRQATFAHLTPETKAVRASVCRELGVKEPWDVELLVAPEAVTVLRSPALSGEEKRADRWASLARALLPANAGQKWLVEDDSSTQRIYLRRIEDKLRNVQEYDWNAPVDLKHLPFGVREDGSPLSLGLLEVNQLLGGTPGGGKSGGLTALLCGIARLENTALIGLDPKRVEQAMWRSRFSRIAKEETDATEVLELMVEEMDRRYRWLEDSGLKKFGPAEFTKERPLLVLVIDELADLVSVGATTEEKRDEAQRSTMIRRLIAKGRAAGVVVIAATQKPQSDVVPTALRDLIQLRVAYATTNSAMTDTILGAGMAGNGGDAHEISASQRGVCYVVSESSRVPTRARTYWVEDDEVEGIAQRYSHLRIDLPWLAGAPVPGPRPAPDAVTVTELDDMEFTLDDLEPEPASSGSIWE